MSWKLKRSNALKISRSLNHRAKAAFTTATLVVPPLQLFGGSAGACLSYQQRFYSTVGTVFTVHAECMGHVSSVGLGVAGWGTRDAKVRTIGIVGTFGRQAGRRLARPLVA